jgi:hypothetical protein
MNWIVAPIGRVAITRVEHRCPADVIRHRKRHTTSVIRTVAAGLAIAWLASAWAQQPEHRLGEHPAVLVKRLADRQGYDYASKFYPHPAWLYLAAEAPRPMMDHPAVIIAKRLRQQASEEAASQPSKVADRGEAGVLVVQP